MRRLLLISALAALGLGGLVAQARDHVPLVREGVQWIYLFDDVTYNPDEGRNDGEGEYVYYMQFRIDSVVNDVTYARLYSTRTPTVDESTTRPVAFVRESDRRVYARINPNGSYPFEYDASFSEILELNNAVPDGQEHLLYDFNDMAGFVSDLLTHHGSVELNEYNSYLVPDSTTAQLDGITVNAWTWAWDEASPQYAMVVEGVGNNMGNLLSVGPQAEPTCLCPVKRGLIELRSTVDGRTLHYGPYYMYPPGPRSVPDATIEDVNRIVNEVLGRIPVVFLSESDLNGDFNVDIDDLNLIIASILGITVEK